MDTDMMDIMDIVDIGSFGLDTGLQIALIIVGVLIGIVAFVSMTVSVWLMIQYSQFNRKENSAGLTGEEVARKVLDDHDLQHIKVKVTGSLLFGNSYSHFFKKVRLRRWTRHKTSVTALGMGAQKACLAILDDEGDPDMKKRIRLYPLITFGPFAFIPMILVGTVLDYLMFQQTGICVYVLGGLGLLFYVYSIVLAVLTLKTEKKAQERAYSVLQRSHMANEEELADLKQLFRLYNIQYINDIIMASLELIYKLLQIALAYAKKDSND
jgi:Zn-dependent membrane protease YugP